MSVQLPPNSTGSIVGTLTSGSKEYQEIILSDGVAPTQLVTALLPGQGLATEVAMLVATNHPADGHKATYSASYLAGSVGTAATTAIAYIAGSATKTVRVLRATFAVTIGTTVEEYDLVAQFETALPSGGTKATAATKVPYDSNSGAATATTAFYTATPTDGTVTGPLGIWKLLANITATATNPNANLVLDFGNRPGQAVVLRGAAQGLVFTINAVTPGHASSWDVTFEWTEE